MTVQLCATTALTHLASPPSHGDEALFTRLELPGSRRRSLLLLSDESLFAEDAALSPKSEPDDDLARRVLGGKSPCLAGGGTSRVRFGAHIPFDPPSPGMKGSVSFNDSVETLEIPLDLWAVAQREREDAERAERRARRREELAKRQASSPWPLWLRHRPRNPLDILMTTSLPDLLTMARQYNIGSMRLLLGLVLVYECAVPMRRQALREKWAILGLVFIGAKQELAAAFARVCVGLAAAATQGGRS